MTRKCLPFVDGARELKAEVWTAVGAFDFEEGD